MEQKIWSSLLIGPETNLPNSSTVPSFTSILAYKTLYWFYQILVGTHTILQQEYSEMPNMIPSTVGVANLPYTLSAVPNQLPQVQYQDTGIHLQEKRIAVESGIIRKKRVSLGSRSWSCRLSMIPKPSIVWLVMRLPTRPFRGITCTLICTVFMYVPFSFCHVLERHSLFGWNQEQHRHLLRCAHWDPSIFRYQLLW